jgi:D-alanyl-D-alanine carboxypeptidase/D-alanyl-D-alanine-endopeptidase (penicillin-binding protein 4)
LVSAIALVAALAMPAAASSATLAQRIGFVVRSSAVAGSTSVYVWDQQTRDILYTHLPERRVAPASTLKLLTGSAALAQFGPDRRFTTRVALTGHQEGRRWIGDIWLIGGGDPSLSTFGFARDNFRGQGANLASLVTPLRDRGIDGVAGRIMVDDDRFDSLRWVPSWKHSFRF